MDPRDELAPSELNELSAAFSDQLAHCLEQCAQGRSGLFSDLGLLEGGTDQPWPEAARLRELALALQGVLAAHGRPSALCDEFLDLCSMHGESHPGEPRLARLFLNRMDRGEVGSEDAGERSG